MQILFAPSMTGELTQTRCDRPQFRIAVETTSAAYALLEKKVEWMPLGGGKEHSKRFKFQLSPFGDAGSDRDAANAPIKCLQITSDEHATIPTSSWLQS